MGELAKREVPAFSMVNSAALMDSIRGRETTLAELIPSRIPDRQAFVFRLARAVGHQCMKNPKLLKCTKESMAHSVMFCAELGFAPDPASSLIHLVPFYNKDIKGHEVVPIVDYKGCQSLAMSLRIAHYIKAVPVFKGDEFEIIEGTSPGIQHKPNLDADRTQEACLGCYAIAPLFDGPTRCEWMSKKDIEKIRMKSPGKDSPAWHNHWLEQAKKTVIHRISKNLGLSPEFARANSVAENYEAGISPWTSQPDVLDTSAGRHRFGEGFGREPEEVRVEVEQPAATPPPAGDRGYNPRGEAPPDALPSDDEIRRAEEPPSDPFER